ncbi:UbiA family prenyltransferase [Acidimicrobiaceae bacterium]|nr:UbiA family prenyltransferase [Acidimicrobiaceae bacterium]
MISILRINQWLKNVLIFIVMFAANETTAENMLILSIIFVGFSFLVSSTYIFNDLIDIESDRNHPVKKKRPLASGEITKKTAKIMILILFIFGNFIIYYSNPSVLLYSSLYLFFNVLYTTKLKYVKYLDLINISILFLIRITIGGEAISTKISIPLYLFVFFSSLAVVTGKKFSILGNSEIKNSKVKTFIKNFYSPEELKSILNISFIFSVFTYLYWSIQVKSFQLLNLSSFFILISIISFVLFSNKFRENTFNSNTEEIVVTLINDKKLLIYLMMFGISFFLGNII